MVRRWLWTLDTYADGCDGDLDRWPAAHDWRALRRGLRLAGATEATATPLNDDFQPAGPPVDLIASGWLAEETGDE